MTNPYEAPQAPLVDAASATLSPRGFGGIQRMPFVGILVAMVVIGNIFTYLLTKNSSAPEFLLALQLLILFSYLAAIFFRLKNIGMSPWWMLLLIVPIANLLILLRCFAFQEGYTEVGKLDTAGRVIMYSLVALLLSSVVAIIFFSLS